MPDTCMNCLCLRDKSCAYLPEVGAAILTDTEKFRNGETDLPCGGDDAMFLDGSESRQARRAITSGDTKSLGSLTVRVQAKMEAARAVKVGDIKGGAVAKETVK